jgi:hypothetical protein
LLIRSGVGVIEGANDHVGGKRGTQCGAQAPVRVSR